MRRFIQTVLIFLLPVIIASLALDRLITEALKRSAKGDVGVWNDLVAGRIDADLAVYGSSRAWVNFDTRILEDSLKVNSYNLGADGLDFLLQYCRHQLLMSANERPAVIVVALDYFMFTKRERLPNPDQFLAHLNEPKLKETLAHYDEFDFFDHHVPIWRYIGRSSIVVGVIRQLVFPESNKPDRYHGYAGKNLTWNTDLAKALGGKRKYVQRIDKDLVDLFEMFVSECRKNEIDLVMVYPPEYIEGQSFVSNRNEIFGLFDSIASRHDIPFLDYSSDSLSRDRSLFYNSQHLNRAGAEKFTLNVVGKLRPILGERLYSVLTYIRSNDERR